MHINKDNNKMNNKTDLIKKIRYHFGLNVYESNVWLALLNKGTATVGEIAEISGVPRSRIYDVLESLEKQGFAIAQLGKPVRYLAVKPAVVLERLKTNALKEAEEKIKVLSNARVTEEYKEIENLHTKGIGHVRPEQLSSCIRGRTNVYAQIKEMLNSAQKEVILVTTTEALKRKISFLRTIFNRLRNNKVNIIIAASSAANSASLSASEKEKDKINFSKELGVPVKKSNINARFCIVDGAQTLFMVTPDKEEENDTAVVIKSPFFSKALTSLFSMAFEK